MYLEIILKTSFFLQLSVFRNTPPPIQPNSKASFKLEIIRSGGDDEPQAQKILNKKCII